MHTTCCKTVSRKMQDSRAAVTRQRIISHQAVIIAGCATRPLHLRCCRFDLERKLNVSAAPNSFPSSSAFLVTAYTIRCSLCSTSAPVRLVRTQRKRLLPHVCHCAPPAQSAAAPAVFCVSAPYHVLSASTGCIWSERTVSRLPAARLRVPEPAQLCSERQLGGQSSEHRHTASFARSARVIRSIGSC